MIIVSKKSHFFRECCLTQQLFSGYYLGKLVVTTSSGSGPKTDSRKLEKALMTVWETLWTPFPRLKIKKRPCLFGTVFFFWANSEFARALGKDNGRGLVDLQSA